MVAGGSPYGGFTIHKTKLMLFFHAARILRMKMRNMRIFVTKLLLITCVLILLLNFAEDVRGSPRVIVYTD